MFEFLARGRGDGIRVLGAADRGDALEVCAQDAVASVLATVQVEALGLRGSYGSKLLGLEDAHGRLDALCWSGANVIPVGVPEDRIPALAAYLARQGKRCSSLVGDAEQVLGLWDILQHSWPRPREVRAEQPSLAIGAPVAAAADPQVRPARRDEFGIVVPASVAMFTEEVGYDPTRMGRAYEARVEELIRGGRTYIRTEPVDPDWREGPRRVVFKADVGALALGVAQIQGVWVAPDRRGHGLATAGMAAVVGHVRRDFAPTVSLYVNDYNSAALALYRKLGFVRVGTYATVLF